MEKLSLPSVPLSCLLSFNSFFWFCGLQLYHFGSYHQPCFQEQTVVFNEKALINQPSWVAGQHRKADKTAHKTTTQNFKLMNMLLHV